MEIVNKVFLAHSFGGTFVFRIPGKNKAFFMIWIQKGYTKKFSIRIWKVKFTIELG